MSWVLVVAGVAVLAGVLVDLIATTLAAGLPGGWLTRRGGVLLWRLARRVLQGHHQWLQIAGLGLVIGVVLTWIGLLFSGWSLVFLGTGGLVDGSGRPAGAGDTLYYVGYTLSTMGNGDLQPATGLAQVLTVVISISGLLSLTLAITYLIPVLSAVAEKRRVAATIHALGPTAAEVAARLWPGGELHTATSVTADLASDIRRMVQRHHSYPVLHLFHSRRQRTAIAPSIAILHVALHRTVIDHDDVPADVHLLATAMDELVDVLLSSFLGSPPDVQLDLPDLDREPARPDYRHDLPAMLAYVRDDGWEWEDVMAPER